MFPFILLLCATARAEPPSARTDSHGDPLPAGARARLGSARYRGTYGSAAALSPDGKTLALPGPAGRIRMLDAATGRELRVLGGQFLGNVMSLVFAPNGSALAVAGHTNQILLLDPATGKELAKYGLQQQPFQLSVSFSTDGRFLAAGTNGFGQNNVTPHVWDTTTGQSLGPFAVLANHQVDVALSPDGQRLATWGQYLPRGAMMQNLMQEVRETVQVWDMATRKEIRRIRIVEGAINRAAFSPDGKMLLVADYAGMRGLWELATGRPRRRWAGRSGTTAFLGFSPDGKTAAALTHTGAAELWDVATGQRRGACLGPECNARGLVFLGDHSRAWGIQGQAVVVWDVPSGKRLTPTDGHLFPVGAVGFTHGGKEVASLSADGKLCRWDAATGRELRHLTLVADDARRYGGRMYLHSVGLSPNGKYLALAQASGNAVSLRDFDTGQVLCDFGGGRMNQPFVAFSADGQRLAVGSRFAMDLRVYDTDNGQELRRWGPAPGNQHALALAFSADGRQLAAARNYFDPNTRRQISELIAWDVATGKERFRLARPNSNPQGLTYSPDGKTLAFREHGRPVAMLDAITGREIRTFAGISPGMAPLAFSPDGHTLAADTFDNQSRKARIVLWETSTGKVRREFSGHEGTISSLAFSPDGGTLASGSSDTTILLWNLTGTLRRPP